MWASDGGGGLFLEVTAFDSGEGEEELDEELIKTSGHAAFSLLLRCLNQSDSQPASTNSFICLFFTAFLIVSPEKSVYAFIKPERKHHLMQIIVTITCI